MSKEVEEVEVGEVGGVEVAVVDPPTGDEGKEEKIVGSEKKDGVNFSNFREEKEPHKGIYLVGYDSNSKEEIRMPVAVLLPEKEVFATTGLSGVMDGVNQTFNVKAGYVSGTTRLYLNGMRLFADIDYIEVGNNVTIHLLQYTPVAGDSLMVEFVVMPK